MYHIGYQPTTYAAEGDQVEWNGCLYSLEIAQHPARARMCGFGEKDRRPITPPPCVRLIVKDAQTKEMYPSRNVDLSFFVLVVDLWNKDGTEEVNIVRHSASAPSISSASASPFPPSTSVLTMAELKRQQQRKQSTENISELLGDEGDLYAQAGIANSPELQQQQQQRKKEEEEQDEEEPQQRVEKDAVSRPQPFFTGSQSQYYAMHPAYYSAEQPTIPSNITPAHGLASHVATVPMGMFTRNMIGSTIVNPLMLTGPDQETGIWFVLTDLSVRTEGNFRLKVNLMSVGTGGKPVETQGPSSMHLNYGPGPVLASAITSVFTVYSAKTFPGMVESTPLSKSFAHQGLKIPIRREPASSFSLNM